MKSNLIYELVYEKNYTHTHTILFSTKKSAIEFFNDCSCDNELSSRIWVNTLRLGADRIYHSIKSEMLYEK